MGRIKSLFMSKYDRLIYHIGIAKRGGLLLPLCKDVVLDFENGLILDSHGNQIKCVYR